MPTKYEENLAFLIQKYQPGMTAHMFISVINPLTFLRKMWGPSDSAKWYNDAKRIMGYSALDDLYTQERYMEIALKMYGNLETYYETVFVKKAA
jgi:hypothetical protein